jgi:hypothetical protein
MNLSVADMRQSENLLKHKLEQEISLYKIAVTTDSLQKGV